MINRRRFLECSSIISTALLLSFESCKKALTPRASATNIIANTAALGITISNCVTQYGTYLIGEAVNISFDVTNITSQSITFKEIHVLFNDISVESASFELSINLANNLTITAGQKYSIVNRALWTVPSNVLLHAFGVFIGGTLQDNTAFANTYYSFFRIINETQLTTYALKNTSYQGLGIQTLDGGLSAEYAVEKAAEALSGGVSHSWFTSSPGSGPNSVYSSYSFLDLALNNTVNYYNQTFGPTATFNTVIISTGVASIPYLSRVIGAPLLPLHFLVSSDSVKEIIAILTYNSQEKGYSTYSTLGYDGSITMAVAWIKLLQLPVQYIDFLNQHHVQNVVIAGTYGSNGDGETTAKKIMYNANPTTGYNNEDLYLMYPGGGAAADFTNLYAKIVDLYEYENMLETSYRTIADWESGIVQEQITNFSSAIKLQTQVTDIRQISSPNSLNMYNLATYLTLTFMQKNQSVFMTDGPAILGVMLNPYLLAHPAYETKIKYIPMLFWQGNSTADDVSRLVNQIQQNIYTYFPSINFKELNFWINTSHNFGGYQAESIQNGLLGLELINIIMNDNTVDEVWNPVGSMTSVCEKVADDIIANSSSSAYKNWDNSLISLNIADLDALATRHNDISVVSL